MQSVPSSFQAVPSSFWGWMASLQSEDRALLVFISFGSVVLIILILAITIHYMHRNRLEASLKRELLDRGMSADEIATVMGAAPSKREAVKLTMNLPRRNQS